MNSNINYLVSGLERSGTSMVMQILRAGGVKCAFDDSRGPDENNPLGYYELEGGKIINRVMEGVFPFEKYRGQFVKITAFGLMFLPAGNYRMIYIERNISEVLSSMEKMAKIDDPDRDATRDSFRKLNKMMVSRMDSREDVDVLFVNYNDILNDPVPNITQIHEFMGNELDFEAMVRCVVPRLYRQRHNNKM